MELIYCGSAEEKRVEDAVLAALAALPRGAQTELPPVERVQAPAQPRLVTETMDVTQGKLAMGYRCGSDDYPAMVLANLIFGGTSNSKLFLNVREKLSLCYYASSIAYIHKGLLLVASGIEFDKFEAARDEIFAQLEAMRRGEITDEEFTAAKRCVASDLRSLTDSQGELEGFYLAQVLDGLDYGPMELAELVEDVTKEDIIRIAQSVECDMIYFLRGLDEEEMDDGEP